MLIRTRSENGKRLSLSIGKLDVDEGILEFNLTIHIPDEHYYNTSHFGLFGSAVDAYKDMEAQYFD
jgi:hypothetical protein